MEIRNEHVRCLLVDFLNAFDSVHHLALVKMKLKTYNTADNESDWMLSFLIDRDQYIKMEDNRSFTGVINRSVVQGFGIDTALFIIFNQRLETSRANQA